MGLAASQARFLSLTARKSDLEYRGQQLNNRRLALTYKMEGIANAYADGMSNQRLMMKVDLGSNQTIPFDATMLAGLDMVLTDSSGFGLSTNAAGQYIDAGGDIISNAEIEERLRLGVIHIAPEESFNNSTGFYDASFDWRSDPTGIFTDEYDETDDAVVSAKYEADSTTVQGEDKRLEMELKNLDVSHKAVQTEMDAVKKVIDKNIESSFKTFG